MQHLLGRKIAILAFVLCCWFHGNAQLFEGNQADHDDKPYHFGINLGYNQSHFRFSHHPQFLQTDTILSIESINSAGINLAWLVNFRLGEHFDIRLHPLDLTFSEKSLIYIEQYNLDGTEVEKKVQSITLSFPIHLKFSSDRIYNFKVYAIGGGKIDYDLASNAGKKKAEELIKIKAFDASAELGLGFHFYFPYFVLTPEIKLSQGFVNLHSRDPDLRYSNVIDKIYSRMITFSVTVE
jgi:hypothetical protein